MVQVKHVIFVSKAASKVVSKATVEAASSKTLAIRLRALSLTHTLSHSLTLTHSLPVEAGSSKTVAIRLRALRQGWVCIKGLRWRLGGVVRYQPLTYYYEPLTHTSIRPEGNKGLLWRLDGVVRYQPLTHTSMRR